MFEKNKIIKIASKFINSTHSPIFLTGRAGTGKTTFLRQISQQTHKNTIITAPTGIAALNAGGVTLHSLFQLPFGTFIPDDAFNAAIPQNFQYQTPESLITNLKMHATKRNLLKKLELLIIDEVSMLRADILDAVDNTLRWARQQRNNPFGGVQILFIGDLQQLPPVVKDQEWQLLCHYYKSLFFFDALVLQNYPLVHIELEKIYRQADTQFINILNNLRDNALTKQDISLLNRHYQPDFRPEPQDGYIYLSTHNYKTEEINQQALEQLPAQPVQYQAEIKGKFDENIYPVDALLTLKINAQVMFVKNDPSGQQLFFNGKIGLVQKLEEDKITVKCEDGVITVAKYKWDNIRYTPNQETNQIEEESIGQFIQFPLKLAWAITIHKSQGLTFDKAIIDVSQAFAAGQVYVALSRLTTLNGLILTAPFNKAIIQQDSALQTFSQQKPDIETLETAYQQASKDYLKQEVMNAFNFHGLMNEYLYHLQTYRKDAVRSEKQKHLQKVKKLQPDLQSTIEVAEKFSKQLQRILQEQTIDLAFLQTRVSAAKGYFEPLLQDFANQITTLLTEIKTIKGVKTYINELQGLRSLFNGQLKKIYKAVALIEATMQQSELTKETLPLPTQMKTTNHQEQKAPPAKQKVDTKTQTLEKFQAGKTIETIAEERGLAVSTIFGHIAHWIKQGEIEAEAILPVEDVSEMLEVFKRLQTDRLTEVREALGGKYSFEELRLVQARWKRELANVQ